MAIYCGVADENGEEVRVAPPSCVCVNGPEGCGKTTGVVVRAIREWPGPVIAVSTKPDLQGHTLGDGGGSGRAARGPVFTFDPSGRLPDGPGSISWDLLAGSEDPNRAMQTAEALTLGAATSDFTVDDGQAVLRAVTVIQAFLHASRVSGLGTSLIGACLPRRDWGQLGAQLTRSPVEGMRAQSRFLLEMARTGEMVPPPEMSVIDRVLGAFVTPSAVRATSAPGLDVRTLLSSTSTLYVLGDRATSPIVSALLQGITDTVRYWAREHRYILDPPLLLVIDDVNESANFENLTACVLEGQRHGMLTLLAGRDVAQAATRWKGDFVEEWQRVTSFVTFLAAFASDPSLRAWYESLGVAEPRGHAIVVDGSGDARRQVHVRLPDATRPTPPAAI